jgi:hypothetical protein
MRDPALVTLRVDLEHVWTHMALGGERRARGSTPTVVCNGARNTTRT